jgi:hypothetical protein
MRLIIAIPMILGALAVAAITLTFVFAPIVDAVAALGWWTPVLLVWPVFIGVGSFIWGQD